MQMNGADLPMLNGFPVRLVVPGYYGTYWVKHLSDITVIDTVFDGFWMKTSYRIPDTDGRPDRARHHAQGHRADRPLQRALLHHQPGRRRQGEGRASTTLKGIAFDGGSGIKQVDVSADGGKSWMPAKLGTDLGKYSFREWTLPVVLAAGPHALKVRATSNNGKVQPETAGWNPPGYMRNVIETVNVTAA